jgi:Cu(I)/Ag(I) efflux system membrane fusion protein
MKIKSIILIIVLAAGAGWFIAKDRRALSQNDQGQKQVWYCPMHPWIKSDKPGGVCPICGMALVPGHAHKQAPVSEIPGYIPITVSQQQQQLIGVRTGLVTKKSVVKTIRAAGRVAYDPELYKAETDYVESYIAYTRLDRRLNNGSYAIQDAQRKLKEEELDLSHMGATEQTIVQLRQNKFPDHSLLVAHAGRGQVFAEVFGSDLGFIDIGQKAIIEIPDYHEAFYGVVKSIDPIIDPASQTARVRIHVNTESELHSNMFVRVSMPVELNEAIIVPREAVMDTGIRKIIFVQKDEGIFEPREIQTGWDTDDGFEVKSGLKEGERIVISGNFLLDSESRVQAGLEEGGSHAS